MSRKKIFIEFIFVSVLGVLLHFTYDWSGQNIIVGLFSATNESTFEHLKLLFFPMLFLTIIEMIIFKDLSPQFLVSRSNGIVGGLCFIVGIFYIFWGVSGYLIDFVNILIYFLGVIFAFYIEKKTKGKQSKLSTLSAIYILVFITIIFVMFTYNHPNLGIFYDLAKHPKDLSF